MEKIKRSTTVNAPVEKVYDYLLDQQNQPEWLPSLVEVMDSTGSDVGDTFRWKYKMAGITFDGETTIKELVPNKRIGTQTKGGITSNFLFNLESQDGGTLMELNIEYTVPIPVLGKLAEKVVLKRNEREADLAMFNIKDKLEG